MTKKERKILAEMYRNLEHPSVEGATYDFDHKTGKLTRTESGETKESMDRKLAAGSDYRGGWEKARLIVYYTLRELGFPPGGR